MKPPTDVSTSRLAPARPPGTIGPMQLLFDSRHAAVCTVSELARQIRDLIGGAFPSVTVLGEIAELTRAASGHHYFCLKDANASIRAIVWANKAMDLGFVLKDGLEVIVRG